MRTPFDASLLGAGWPGHHAFCGRLTLTLWLAAGMLLPAATPAAIVQYSLSAQDNSKLTFEQELFGVPLGSGLSLGVSQGSSSASIVVDPGRLRLRAESTWPGGVSSEAVIELTDTFILTSIAPPGAGVVGAYLSASLSVSGALAQSNGEATWRSTALLSAPVYRSSGFAIVQPWSEADVTGRESATFGPAGPPLPTTFSTTTPALSQYTGFFLVGEPVSVRLTFGATAGCFDCSSAGFARASLEDTLVWLGITARDENGNIIEGLSFISESGIDWGNPPAVIPLPGAAWLLLSALGAIMVLRDRRPQDPAPDEPHCQRAPGPAAP